MLTTASITLNDKTGMSRYGKTNGPIARRRQPTNPAQSAFAGATANDSYGHF